MDDNETKDVRQERWWSDDYLDTIKKYGDILLICPDFDWQGDYRILYWDKTRGDKYGILIFGYGSCSGCDALQGCKTFDDWRELNTQLESSIQWGTSQEILDYLRNHDWEGDYSARSYSCRQFVAFAIALIEANYGLKTELGCFCDPVGGYR